MPLSPEQFRTRCLIVAQEVREDYPGFSEGLVKFAQGLPKYSIYERPLNDSQVLREFEQGRNFKEIRSF